MSLIGWWWWKQRDSLHWCFVAVSVENKYQMRIFNSRKTTLFFIVWLWCDITDVDNWQLNYNVAASVLALAVASLQLFYQSITTCWSTTADLLLRRLQLYILNCVEKLTFGLLRPCIRQVNIFCFYYSKFSHIFKVEFCTLFLFHAWSGLKFKYTCIICRAFWGFTYR